MPSTLQIIRQREQRRSRRNNSTREHAGRAVFGIGFLLSILLVAGLVGAALAYANLTRSLPSIETLPILLNETDGLLLQPTRIYDRSGQVLLEEIAPAGVERSYLPLDEFPDDLIDATLALADEDFWRHGGYDLDGWQDAESHPTLAQRLAADLLLWDEAPAGRRGLRERLLAAQITAEYGREQVLEWYLNNADYGNFAYGADTAARLYLGKPVSGLDLGESVLLAAVSQAPALNPFDAPEAAEQLRQEALQEMLSQERITVQQAAAAAGDPPEILPAPSDEIGEGSAFINLVLEQLGQHFDADRIRRGGLVVISSMDAELQSQAGCVVRSEITRLSGQSGSAGVEDSGDCAAARYLQPAGSAEMVAEASASALILDPRTGQVLAVVGDVRSGDPGAYLQTHPAGTLLTPFLYLSGFSRGLGPASLGWDIPGGLTNFDGQYIGPVRLRTALVNDLLPPAQVLLEQLGAESVQQDAAQFGLGIPAGSALLEDDIPVSLLDAAAAYGVFANQGTLAGQELESRSIQPVTVLSVFGVDGAVWADWTTAEVQAVISPQLAYLMTDILTDNSVRLDNSGLSTLLEQDFPAAVKLGRSFDQSGAWVTGYTPGRVVVVHVSAQASAELSAARLWQALMAYVQQDLPEESWDLPNGLTVVDVCDPSGMLPTPACPMAVKELFITGNEPVQADTLYQTSEINRETGLLATIFTPAELVEERTFMIVPEQAKNWAEAKGVPVAPDEYDVLMSVETLPDVHISLPALFAQVAGVVEVRGRAAGEDLSSYRLAYGQGLNPHAWVQIGTDSRSAVDEGVLGSWDTTGLEGLYVLRLQVVRTDLRVEQAMVVVTITAP